MLINTSPQQNITEDEYHLLRDLVYAESGIWLNDEKQSFLMNRAARRMRELSITSYYRYYKLLTGPEAGKKELLDFLDALTINETSFFRNKPQMDVLSRKVLPEIVERKRKDGRLGLKMWSAGCSTGQEPYTLAIILREAVPDLRNWQIKVLASDLSTTALEAAGKGVYAPEKMEGVDKRLLGMYFCRDKSGYRVTDEIKRLVVFDHHNLMHDNGEKDFDVIFCRNVLIYFDGQTQKKVIGRLRRALVPEGYLFLGHSETLQGIDDSFTFIHHNRGTAYRKNCD